MLHGFHNLFTEIFDQDSGRDLLYRYLFMFTLFQIPPWGLFEQGFDRGPVCRIFFVLIARTFKGTSLDLQIFTYTGPIDSLRQASHPSHLLLHNLHHSIHTLLRRRLPRLLHMLLNFGPTLRPVTRRPPQLHLRTHSHIKDSLLDQPVQPGV